MSGSASSAAAATAPRAGRKPRDPNAPVKTRAPSAPKKVFAVVQVLDEHGEPLIVAKGTVKLISFEKSAEKVLEAIDSGKFPGALYLSGMMPAGR